MAWGLSRILMCVAAVAIAAVGIAVAFVAAPALLTAAVSGALIGGGLSALATVVFGEKPTWGDFCKQLCIGAVIGAVSSAFSFGASALVSRFVGAGVSKITQLLIYAAVHIPVSTFSAVATNGIANIFSGRSFFDGAGKAAAIGAILGVISTGCRAWQLYNLHRAEQIAKQMISGVKDQVSGVRNIFEELTNRIGAKTRWALQTTLEMGLSAAQSAAIQFFTTGEVSWKMVAFSALAYGGLKLGRAGMKYRQKIQNDKLLRDVHDEYDKKTQANANRFRKNEVDLDPEWQERAAEDRPQEADGTEASTPAAQVDEPTRPARVENTDKPECVGGIRDNRTDKTYFGANYKQRLRDQDIVPNRKDKTQPPKAHVDNPLRADMKTRYAGGTIRAATAKEVAGMSEEARANVSQRACAEPDMIAKMDADNEKNNVPLADLHKDTTTYTVGSGTDGMTVFPPCPVACESIGGHNLSTQPHLAQHLEGNFIAPSGEAPPVYRLPTTSSTTKKHAKQTKTKKGYVAHIDDELQLLEKLKKEKREEEERHENQSEFMKNSRPVYQEQRVESSTTPAGTPAKRERRNASDHEGASSTRIPTVPSDSEISGDDNDSRPSVDTTATTSGGSSKTSWKSYFDPLKTPKVKSVGVYPIVAWSEKHNKYMMTDPDVWPRFPKDGIRFVGILGMHQSGRTTLLHSLIYSRGYVLTEEQCVITRIALGVNLYVLEDEKLAFLDVCDSLDSVGEEQQRSTPLGSLLLEVFAYLTCDHLLYNLQYENRDNPDNEMTPEFIDGFISNRLSLLAFSASALDRFGSRNISIVLRAKKPSTDIEAQWRQLEKKYSLKNVVSTTGDVASSKPPLTTESYLVDDFHDVRICPLRYTQTAKSTLEAEAYSREFDILTERIESDTEYHFAVEELQKVFDSTMQYTVKETMLTIWNNLLDSEELKKAVICVNNKELAERESKDDFGVQAFFDRVSIFQNTLTNDARCSDLARDLDDFHNWSEVEGKKFAAATDEDKDQLLFVRMVLKVSSIILRGSRNLDLISVKAEGIRLALEGFTLLLDKETDSKTTNLIVLRMALVEFDLIRQISDPAVYLNYSRCWYLLSSLAVCGFRMRLLEFPIWDAIVQILESGAEPFGDKLLVYKNALNLLVVLLDDSDLDVLPAEETAQQKVDGLHFNQVRAKKLSLLYEMQTGEWIKNLLKELLSQPSSCKEKNEALMARQESWFNESEFAKQEKIRYEQLATAVKDTFTKTTMRLLFKECAKHFASLVLQNSRLFLSRKLEHYCEEIVKQRLSVLRQVAALAASDEALLLSILRDSAIVNWLIVEFLTKESSSSLLLTAAAMQVTAALLYAEQSVESKAIREKIVDIVTASQRHAAKGKVHDLEEVKRREYRTDQISRFGLVRLLLLEKKTVSIAVDRLCDSDDTAEYKKFLAWMLVYCKDDKEKELSLNIYVRRRGAIIKRVTDWMTAAAASANPKNETLSIIHDCCDLLNRLMWTFYAHDHLDFYKSPEMKNGESCVQEMPSWKYICAGLDMCYQKIIVGRQNIIKALGTKNRDSLESAARSFLSLAYNVSSTCKIPLSTVKKQEHQDNGGACIITPKDTEEPDEPKIVAMISQFAELHLDNENEFDFKNVKRSAYVLHKAGGQSCATIRHTLTGSFIAEVKSAKMLVDERNETKAMRQGLEAEKKRIGNANLGAQCQNRLPSMVSTALASTQATTLRSAQPACHGVFLRCNLIGELLPREDFDQRARALLTKDWGEAIASAYMLLLLNKNKQDEMKRLQRHFQRLLQTGDEEYENYLQIKVENETMKRILSLRGGERAFLMFGYTRQVNKNGAEIFGTSRDVIKQQLDKIESFLATLSGGVITCSLDTEFSPVTSGETLHLQTLPPSFFTSENADLLAELTTKTIEQLRQLKAHSSQLLNGVETSYILVRIKDSDENMWQAVFSSEMLVSGVIKGLRNASVRCDSLRSPSGDIFHSASVLRDVASFALFAHAV